NLILAGGTLKSRTFAFLSAACSDWAHPFVARLFVRGLRSVAANHASHQPSHPGFHLPMLALFVLRPYGGTTTFALENAWPRCSLFWSFDCGYTALAWADYASAL